MYPTFDIGATLTYNTWLRSPQPAQPRTRCPSARAHNYYDYYERSVNLSGSTTQTKNIQRATQSSSQSRCSEARASRGLPAMSRDAIASPGLPLVRHLSRRQGDRDQGQKEEIRIDHFLSGEILPRPCRGGFACTALVVSRPCSAQKPGFYPKTGFLHKRVR